MVRMNWIWEELNKHWYSDQKVSQAVLSRPEAILSWFEDQQNTAFFAGMLKQLNLQQIYVAYVAKILELQPEDKLQIVPAYSELQNVKWFEQSKYLSTGSY